MEFVDTGSPRGERGKAITLSSVLFYLTGLVWAVAFPPFLAYLAYFRTAPTLFGIQTPGETSRIGEILGLDGVIVLGIVFVAVMASEVLAGYWLWKSLRRGGQLGIATLPFEIFYAVGYGLPFFYLFTPLKLVLLVSGWKSLHR